MRSGDFDHRFRLGHEGRGSHGPRDQLGSHPQPGLAPPLAPTGARVRSFKPEMGYRRSPGWWESGRNFAISLTFPRLQFKIYTESYAGKGVRCSPVAPT